MPLLRPVAADMLEEGWANVSLGRTQIAPEGNGITCVMQVMPLDLHFTSYMTGRLAMWSSSSLLNPVSPTHTSRKNYDH